MKKITTINVAVTAEVKKKLTAVAVQMDLKLSDVVRFAINSYLEARSKDQAA